jgi:hypothetical protein
MALRSVKVVPLLVDLVTFYHAQEAVGSYLAVKDNFTYSTKKDEV